MRQQSTSADRNESTGPVKKFRAGRFQLTLWRFEKVKEARDDYDAERVGVRIRACVEYGRYNRRKQQWENERIWCDPHELRDLAWVLDQLNTQGGSPPARASGRVLAQ